MAMPHAPRVVLCADVAPSLASLGVLVARLQDVLVAPAAAAAHADQENESGNPASATQLASQVRHRLMATASLVDAVCMRAGMRGTD